MHFFFLSFFRRCVILFIRSTTNLSEFLVLLFALVHSSYVLPLICQPPGGPRDTGWKGARIPHAILNCQGLQWLFLLAGSSLPDGMFAGFAGAALKFKKFAESSVCRIYWINAARLCTEKQLGKANRCLHRICSLCILNNALLVSIGVVSAACWRHPEMETLIIQPGSANHFFCRITQANRIATLQLFFLHMPSRRVMLHNFCSSVRSVSATCQDCFWFDVVQETWLYVISPV